MQGGTGLVCLWGRMKPFGEREPIETFLGVRPLSESGPHREWQAPPPPALGGDEHTLPGPRGHTTLPST